MCSSYGQNLQTSTYSGETLFSSFICIAGLILFAHLIGNMQVKILQTLSKLNIFYYFHFGLIFHLFEKKRIICNLQLQELKSGDLDKKIQKSG